MKAAAYAVLALLVAAILGNVLQFRWFGVAASQHEEERRLWNAQMDSTTEWARDSVQLAKAELEKAQDALDAAFVLAGHAQARTDTLRIEVERVRLIEVPDTCRAVVAARDSLIERGRIVAEGYEAAYRNQARATTRALRSASLYGLAYDSVAAVLEARPRPRGKWSPRLAVVAGVWDDRSYDAGLEIKIGHVEVLGGLCDSRRCGRIGVRYPLF